MLLYICLRNSSKSKNPLEKRVPLYSGAYNDFIFFINLILLYAK